MEIKLYKINYVQDWVSDILYYPSAHPPISDFKLHTNAEVLTVVYGMYSKEL